ncbi:hypothetical protein DE146DRAFT_786894 [Phaeosphaeria sp. MPI-PUGE-AT-0046c]|nr:hypothetical protein DE146DRAFT_786894 [Phaeosphaeria sp. MPI-PUGE-AT-0046c]
MSEEPVYTFSPLDYVLPPLYVANIYTFPCPNHFRDPTYEILEKALELLVDEHPLLGANISRDTSPSVRPGTLRLSLDSSAPGELITRVDQDIPGSSWPPKCNYPWLKAHGMPPFALDAALLAPHAAGMKQSSRPLQIQINFIDGGCLLSLCIAHCFSDAWGLGLIVESWAAKCRMLQGVSRNPQSFDSPGLDFLTSSPSLKAASNENFEKLKERPEVWNALCLDETRNKAPDPEIPPLPTTLPTCDTSPAGEDIRSCVFTFETKSLLRLRSQASSPGQSARISIGDALTALLWRHVMRARFPNPPQEEAIMCMAVDIRNSALKPAIPLSYPGNSILFGTAALSPQRVTDSCTPLHELASTLRSAIEVVRSDDALIKDSISLAASMPNVGMPAIKLHDFLGLHLNTVNWSNMPFANIDFGPIFDGNIVCPFPYSTTATKHRATSHNGRAEYFRFPRGQFGGICGIFPKRADGTVEVFIGLKSEDMMRLKQDKEFTSYCRNWTLSDPRNSNI